ncbi:MAG TPA: DNA primase [bacterium]|nr:DNA primase [bacterium]HPN45442.1 DNA primase [bacterium]
MVPSRLAFPVSGIFNCQVISDVAGKHQNHWKNTTKEFFKPWSNKVAGQISPAKIDEVRFASDIVSVISGYLSLQKKGRNYFGLCPFHKEKTPSFSVNAEQQIFHCFGCGEGGNVFTFITKIEGLTFPESVRFLAKAAGIIIPEDEQEDIAQYRQKEALYHAINLAAEFYENYLLTAKAAQKGRDYLQNRGIPQSVFKTFGIGFAPDGWDHLLTHAEKQSVKPETLEKAGLVIKKQEGGYYDRFRGRVTFAIRNINGQVVGFGARRIVNDNTPKYINSPETDIYQKRHILYGLYQARDFIRRENRVIIVEGYTDYTSMFQNGVQNVVATSGTALTEDHARLLHRYTPNAIILYDNDSAGAAAALRGAEILLASGMEVSICIVPQGKDPDEFARAHGEKGVREMLEQAAPFLDFKMNNISGNATPAQQAETIRDLLGTFSKISDPLKKTLMLKNAAEKFQIQESLLWEEIKKLEHQSGFIKNRELKDTKINITGNYFQTKKGAAELGLMTAVFINPDLIPGILQNLDMELLAHEEIQNFFIYLRNSNITPIAFDSSHYLGAIQDEHIARSLSKLLTDNQNHKAYYTWQYAYDCIIALQYSAIENEIKLLRQELQKNPVNARDIMEKIKTCEEQKKAILAGQYVEKKM